MTQQKTFKRRVRARMAKTGESYTAARRRLIADGQEPPPAFEPTVTYERARGLRALGEGANGFSVSASRSIAVPAPELFAAFDDPGLRERWLPGAELSVRTTTPPRLAHERLAGADERDRMK